MLNSSSSGETRSVLIALGLNHAGTALAEPAVRTLALAMSVFMALPRTTITLTKKWWRLPETQPMAHEKCYINVASLIIIRVMTTDI